jgi:hypothetical protein
MSKNVDVSFREKKRLVRDARVADFFLNLYKDCGDISTATIIWYDNRALSDLRSVRTA